MENTKQSPLLAKEDGDREGMDPPSLNTQGYLFIFSSGSKNEVRAQLRILLSDRHSRVVKVQAHWCHPESQSLH